MTAMATTTTTATTIAWTTQKTLVVIATMVSALALLANAKRQENNDFAAAMTIASDDVSRVGPLIAHHAGHHNGADGASSSGSRQVNRGRYDDLGFAGNPLAGDCTATLEQFQGVYGQRAGFRNYIGTQVGEFTLCLNGPVGDGDGDGGGGGGDSSGSRGNVPLGVGDSARHSDGSGGDGDGGNGRLNKKERLHKALETLNRAKACLLYTSPSPRDRG